MRLARLKRRSHGETVIALIDVVFFLLVFAMLAGRMDATAPFEIAPPIATSGSDLQKGGVTLSISPTGALALDGELIERDRVAPTVMKRLALVGPKAEIRINADEKTALRQVLPIVDALEDEGAKRIVFVVTPDPA